MTMFWFLLLITFFFTLHISLLQHPELDPARAVLTLEEFRTASSREQLTSSIRANNLKGLKAHPHQGALDEHGNPGYVHDTQYVKNHPLPLNHHPDSDLKEGICDLPPGKGIEGPAGIYALQKIKNRKSNDTSSPDILPKVLCIVYTHSNAHHALLAVVETYGQRCDGFMAASNKTDISLGAVNILHEGPEVYDNMWQKVRSIWAYVHDNYLDDYDWFHIGGDNMFVIPENLKLAAHEETTLHKEKKKKTNAPIYMGGAMWVPPRRKWRICGGGAGYTLNRQALLKMVRQEFRKPHCAPTLTTAEEDVSIANCLRKNVANCTNSFDVSGETRYHPFDAQYHAAWKKWKVNNWNWENLLKFHNIDLSKETLESISQTTVSFHMTGHKAITTKFSDMGMRRYHAILYGQCPEHIYKALDPTLNLATMALDS
jgi:glycoprotein-N-acetylgalactosamine 3-beta-galactosyltransferase